MFALLLLVQTVVSAEDIGLGEDPYIEQGSFSLILFIYETGFCQFVHLNSEEEMFRGILKYFSFYVAKRFLSSLGWPTVNLD